MAHKKAGGSTKNGRDSESKRLGVKIYGGQEDYCWKHHCSSAWHAFPRGRKCWLGRDHTLFAKKDGFVKFERKGPKNRQFVSVVDA